MPKAPGKEAALRAKLRWGAEEEAKRLRALEAEQRRQEYEDEVQERSKERGPQARGLLPMGAFWDLSLIHISEPTTPY